MERIDNNNIALSPSEILLFCCIRNELLRLPFFLDYYRNLGVARFFFVDNASSDETRAFLLQQGDVHLFFTKESYASSRCGVDWLNKLLSAYGANHWTLTVDADELLVFPGCEDYGLALLIDFLDELNCHALSTFLLDMYSDLPIKRTVYRSGFPFHETCPYFDADTYHERDDHNLPVRGGPRHRLFWQGRHRKKPSPVLKKIPLVKWRKQLAYQASTHILSNVTLAPVTGVLQHYKFFSDFFDLAKDEVGRKEHWDNAAQYDSYWDVLRTTPDLNAHFTGSVQYVDSMQLVSLGLIHCPQSYIHFMSRYSREG